MLPIFCATWQWGLIEVPLVKSECCKKYPCASIRSSLNTANWSCREKSLQLQLLCFYNQTSATPFNASAKL